MEHEHFQVVQSRMVLSFSKQGQAVVAYLNRTILEQKSSNCVEIVEWSDGALENPELMMLDSLYPILINDDRRRALPIFSLRQIDTNNRKDISSQLDWYWLEESRSIG